jgi:hypothetical protein
MTGLYVSKVIPRLAENVLVERERRVSALKLRELPTAERDRYLHQWAQRDSHGA